jgi:hypothetical protein
MLAAMAGETLNYEQLSPRRWRRRILRWTGRIVVAGVLLGLAALGWWQRNWISDWVGWQLAMRNAWGHEMPPDGSSILVNGDKGAALSKVNEDYALGLDGIATYHPAVLPRLADYDWRFETLDDFARREPPPIAFMGALSRPDG